MSGQYNAKMAELGKASAANMIAPGRLRGVDYPDAGEMAMPRLLTLRERLLSQRAQHAAEVERLDKALALLEDVPKVEELLDLLGGRF